MPDNTPDNTPPASQPNRSNDRVKELFDRLHDLSSSDRKAILDKELANDLETRAAVESLLAASDAASQFMATPTLDNAAVTENTLTTPPMHSTSDFVSQQIGPYKLLQPIGEGGFGTVYLAEQTAPVRRRVALKVIKPGMDSRQVIARFEAERQALAMMDHPNIARVFDAGTTEKGHPYFVMELVNGVPITEYCDQNMLSARQRLELFIPVCQAVQHAHQKGVIHRDIKPSNVLITLHDGKPVPKVIDFGIAKAIHSPLTDKTLFTELRTMIGTLEYMAPEQAEISGLDVDTRSDVYSLGVLLYELLTGTTPFDPKELRSKVYAEIQRVLREVEPPRPSTRLSTLATLPSVAAKRSSDPRRLGALMRGELDWVVMKCLEKDRTRRYDSPAALSADVGRYLTGDVVVAHPPGAGYRLAKFVRKHRAALSVATIIFVALAIGLVVALLGLRRARAAEALATQRLEQTQREAAKSAAINDFLNNMLRQADPFATGTGDLTVRQMLEASAKRIDAGELSNDPAVNAEVRTTIAMSLRSLGHPKEAIAQVRLALAALKPIRDKDDPEISAAMNTLGSALADDNQVDEAEQVLREAARIARRRFGSDSSLVSESRGNLASVLEESGKLPEAEKLLRAAIATDEVRAMRDNKSAASESAGEGSNLITHLEDLAVVLNHLDKVDDSEKASRRALDILAKSGSKNDAERIHILTGLTNMLVSRRRTTDAMASQQQAVDLARRIFPASSQDMAFVLNTNGNVLVEAGKYDEGVANIKEALTILKTLFGPAHPKVADVMSTLAEATELAGDPTTALAELRERCGSCASFGDTSLRSTRVQVRIGLVQTRQHHFAEAEQSLRELYELMKTAPTLENPLELERVKMHLANAISEQRLHDPEARMMREVVDAFRKANLVEENVQVALLDLASLDQDDGRILDFQSHLRELLEMNRKIYPAPNASTARIQTMLANSYAKHSTNLEDAETLARAALTERQSFLPPDAWQTKNTQSLIGEILMKRGRIDEASPMIHETFDALDRDAHVPPGIKTDARNRLIQLYERQGNPAAADTLRAATRPTTATTAR